MQSCETCRWWNPDDAVDKKNREEREQWEEENPNIDESYYNDDCEYTGKDRPCAMFELRWDKPMHPESKAIIWSSDFGELWTQPDFGCIQWEAKGAT